MPVDDGIFWRTTAFLVFLATLFSVAHFLLLYLAKKAAERRRAFSRQKMLAPGQPYFLAAVVLVVVPGWATLELFLMDRMRPSSISMRLSANLAMLRSWVTTMTVRP